MDNLVQDIRFALRSMIKNPSFTLVAIASLAIGIGANTSIFSIVNQLLLKPLPYRDPNRLAQVFLQTDEPGKGIEISELWSYPKFAALRDHNDSFESVAVVSDLNFPVTDSENPERLSAEMVSASYFSLLGVEAVIGRTFSPDEDRTPGASPVAVLGYGCWERRFGASRDVIGRTISLNKVPLTIVGVMPRGFKGQKGTAEVWVPVMMAPQLTFPRRLAQPFASWTEVIARIKPELNLAQAQNEMPLVSARVREAIPIPANLAGKIGDESILLTSLKEAKIDPSLGRSMLVLFGAVGFVLLIACANLANLLLGKSVGRRREIAVRMALGASRGRLVRQLLTESVILSLAGGIAGLLVALWGVELLSAFKPAHIGRSTYLAALDFSKANIDGQVLLFNFVLSVFTGILFGLFPALQGSREEVSIALKNGNATSGLRGSSGWFNSRRLLVMAEIALTLVLLIGAGLMIRSFSRLQSLEVGFSPHSVMTMRIDLPKYKQEAEIAFDEHLLQRIESLPGIESATVASSTPLSSNSASTIMKIKGQPESELNFVGLHSIGPDYFRTLRIPVQRGRTFNDQDRSAQRVAIINEKAAQDFFPDEDPIGKEIWLGAGMERDQFAEIVGVVGNVKYGRVEEEFKPAVYLPYLQPTEPAWFVLARTTVDPTRVLSAIRAEVLALDQNVPVFDIRTLEDRSADATSRTRFTALLLGIFSTLALMLAAVGIYGVMSYSVSRRTKEIGVRMALGANPGQVLSLVMRDGLAVTIVGLLLGGLGGLATTRVLGSQLYGVTTTDALTFVIVSMLLATVALASSYLPARRAMKVDPLIALRYE